MKLAIAYETTVTALCPNEPHQRHFYRLHIESESFIWAERVEEVARLYDNEKRSQESITEAIASQFPGTKVTLQGLHGAVGITSTATTEAA